MTKTNKTEIVFIMDKSGSMMSIKDDAIGGFNSFVKEQLEQEGETNVTLVLFDHHVETLVGVHELTDATYQPSGMTALLDAIGIGIDNLNKRLSEQEEQPDNVIFAIMTDGYENMSKEYNAQMVRNKIENMQKEKDYQFIFLGANIDAVGTAQGLGIKGEYAGQFVADSFGTTKVMNNMSKMATSYRASGQMISYVEADNEDNDNEGI